MFLIKYMLSSILLTVVVSSAKLNETPVDTQLEQQEILIKDNIKLPVKIEEATVNVDKIANTDNITLEGKLSNIETLNKEDKIILTEQPTTERAVVTELNVITEKSTEESTVSAKSLDAEKTTTETTIQTTIPTTTAAVTEKEIKTKKTTLVEVTTEQIISTTNADILAKQETTTKRERPTRPSRTPRTTSPRPSKITRPTRTRPTRSTRLTTTTTRRTTSTTPATSTTASETTATETTVDPIKEDTITESTTLTIPEKKSLQIKMDIDVKAISVEEIKA